MKCMAANELPYRALACWLAVVGLGVVGMMPTARAETPVMPTTPQAYERFALENHPGLRAQYDRWLASLSESEAARARMPQPMVGYTGEFDLYGQESWSSQHMVMVSQRVPWPGTLDANAVPAREEARARQERFGTLVLDVVFDVRRLLIGIARIDQMSEVLDEERGVYRDAILMAEETMAVGGAEYGDVLRLNLMAEMLADRLDMLQSERTQRVQELRRVLNVGPDVDLALDFPDVDLLDVSGELPALEEMVAAMSQDHPELQARDTDARVAAARASAAHQARLPSPTFSLGFMSMRPGMGSEDRMGALVVGASIPLPIFKRQYSADVERFEYLEGAIRRERVLVERDLATRIQTSLTRIEERQARLQRYRTELLPLATDATEHLIHDIELGRARVTEYLLAFQQQLDLQTSMIELRADIATERARLDLLTAGRVFGPREDTITIKDMGGKR